MTISYNWLSEYLPEKIEPESLSGILTSVGLEVEKMETFEEIKGGLKGLVIGEVLQSEQHPNADKLKLTKVTIGNGEPLQIVCGAPNVKAGQKVIVATVGTTIYPVQGEPLTMKVAKIRGVESYGMICAEDEIGIGHSHAGIMVLPADVHTGMPAADFFKPYSDTIYEIGLTPNRMDAMSHWGVARDVCAYLSHHQHKPVKPVIPEIKFKADKKFLDISVVIENKNACRRYSGVCLSGIRVGESPKWLQEKLKSIGVRPINNIVDITNFIQHETGQPLHAFDYDAIDEKKIIVKNLPGGTPFVTLDDKERKLHADDLMICSTKEPMCIAGVFGGLHSGVTEKTTNIFLESAWFDPVTIRKTSFRHGLRTDAATRFEKGTDISQTVTVLQRAAMMVKEITGGIIASDIIDEYVNEQPKTQVTLSYSYLKKLSGKEYNTIDVQKILESLGFKVKSSSKDSIELEVPYHKPDVSLAADVVEEILRIDGLDNIEIPTSIRMSPSLEENYRAELTKEKISQVLTGLGFSEILTNSITNSSLVPEKQQQTAVKMLNSLSSELNMLRPTMVPTALDVISFNLNRKNSDLKFFEFGKTYSMQGSGKFHETEHLCLYVTGQVNGTGWKGKGSAADIFYIRGIVENVLTQLGLQQPAFRESVSDEFLPCLAVSYQGKKIAGIGKVKSEVTSRFDIKQPVYIADFLWEELILLSGKPVKFREIPKYQSVERDLAIIVPQTLKYEKITEQISGLRLEKLRDIKLFDIFESEKLGAGKKSLAINLSFLDEEKTLTDKEIDAWMNKIMAILEKELSAEIRK